MSNQAPILPQRGDARNVGSMNRSQRASATHVQISEFLNDRSLASLIEGPEEALIVKGIWRLSATSRDLLQERRQGAAQTLRPGLEVGKLFRHFPEVAGLAAVLEGLGRLHDLVRLEEAG